MQISIIIARCKISLLNQIKEGKKIKAFEIIFNFDWVICVSKIQRYKTVNFMEIIFCNTI